MSEEALQGSLLSICTSFAKGSRETDDNEEPWLRGRVSGTERDFRVGIQVFSFEDVLYFLWTKRVSRAFNCKYKGDIHFWLCSKFWEPFALSQAWCQGHVEPLYHRVNLFLSSRLITGCAGKSSG